MKLIRRNGTTVDFSHILKNKVSHFYFSYKYLKQIVWISKDWWQSGVFFSYWRLTLISTMFVSPWRVHCLCLTAPDMKLRTQLNGKLRPWGHRGKRKKYKIWLGLKRHYIWSFSPLQHGANTQITFKICRRTWACTWPFLWSTNSHVLLFLTATSLCMTFRTTW